ncbi:TPA: hypothetical protein NJ227_000670 [Vibrio parahaemolyticus]|uniref:hypothetical protein n=1 Tax=Vibrio parahaemolyticus TaxID=670 RepID=UPI002360C213|nr:hypothetical protein [Vibrio parahaemolyticus]HCG6603361.1 hypothetical protein [Vibrio parahaemolyticus]
MQALEKNQQKILETRALLREIIQNPENFASSEQLRKALKSQMGLAKFEDEDRGIVACSLNTVKSTSEALFDRGFIELDELRNNAKDAIEKSILGEKTNKATRTGLKYKVKQLEQQLEVTQQSNFLLTSIISEMRAQLKRMSESEDSLEVRKELYEYYNKKIEAQLNYTLNGSV